MYSMFYRVKDFIFHLIPCSYGYYSKQLEKITLLTKENSSLKEELHELSLEINKGHKKNIESEFGDVLFSLINYARFIDVDPESALERTNKKFIKRFQFIEEAAKKEGKQLTDMSLAEMDVHWEKSKTFFK